VTTVANSTGEAVVKYFSGQIDVMPQSCHSFVTMDDDTSRAAKVCEDWGLTKTQDKKVGKWSSFWSDTTESRSYERIVVVHSAYHWLIRPQEKRVECDDYKGPVSAGDFWKMYVR